MPPKRARYLQSRAMIGVDSQKSEKWQDLKPHRTHRGRHTDHHVTSGESPLRWQVVVVFCRIVSLGAWQRLADRRGRLPLQQFGKKYVECRCLEYPCI